jgi:hypothetical protein
LKGVVVFLVALACSACSRRVVDPPPPATSAEIPTAPPKALGARAASLAPPELPGPLATSAEPDEEMDPGPDADAGAGEPDAGGTAL